MYDFILIGVIANVSISMLCVLILASKYSSADQKQLNDYKDILMIYSSRSYLENGFFKSSLYTILSLMPFVLVAPTLAKILSLLSYQGVESLIRGQESYMKYSFFMIKTKTITFRDGVVYINS